MATPTINELVSRSHCRHCIDRKDLKRKRPHGLRRPNPKSTESVYIQVVHLLDAALAQGLVEVGSHITKEAVAAKLGVPEHFVAVAFMRLNREGRLSRGSNKAPHDSTRDPWGGHDSAWRPTHFSILA